MIGQPGLFDGGKLREGVVAGVVLQYELSSVAAHDQRQGAGSSRAEAKVGSAQSRIAGGLNPDGEDVPLLDLKRGITLIHPFGSARELETKGPIMGGRGNDTGVVTPHRECVIGQVHGTIVEVFEGSAEGPKGTVR